VSHGFVRDKNGTLTTFDAPNAAIWHIFAPPLTANYVAHGFFFLPQPLALSVRR
jgi:hypothetical protein